MSAIGHALSLGWRFTAWNYTTWLNIAFLILAALPTLRFFRTGGVRCSPRWAGHRPAAPRTASHPPRREEARLLHRFFMVSRHERSIRARGWTYARSTGQVKQRSST
jgi:hypothetical protein